MIDHPEWPGLLLEVVAVFDEHGQVTDHLWPMTPPVWELARRVDDFVWSDNRIRIMENRAWAQRNMEVFRVMRRRRLELEALVGEWTP